MNSTDRGRFLKKLSSSYTPNPLPTPTNTIISLKSSFKNCNGRSRVDPEHTRNANIRERPIRFNVYLYISKYRKMYGLLTRHKRNGRQPSIGDNGLKGTTVLDNKRRHNKMYYKNESHWRVTFKGIKVYRTNRKSVRLTRLESGSLIARIYNQWIFRRKSRYTKVHGLWERDG